MFRTFLLKLRRARSAAASGALDKKLIRNIRRRLIPTAAQFKYIFRFLNPTEKKIVLGALAVMVAAGLAMAGIFTVRHIALAPRAGGEYIEALAGEPKMINPLFASVNEADADLTSLIYSGLFHYNAEQRLTPDLAADYSVSADKKTYEISLRRDVSWSDGEPFTADDVLFTFESIQNPEVGSPLYPAFQGARVEKINDYAVRFVLKMAFAPFLEGLAVGILPEHVWANVAPANVKLAKNNLQPIGSGPWKFEKLTKDEAGTIQSYSLKRNEKYYGQQPYLQTLTFRFCADYEQAGDLLRAKEALAASFVPRQSKEKLPRKSLNFHTLRLPQYTALFFNRNREPLLKDADLRLALARAIDKDRLVSEALEGEGEAMDAPIPRGILGYHSALPRTTYDSGEANKLLDKNWPAVNPEDFFKIKRDELLKTRGQKIEELKKATSTPETTAALAALENNLTAAVRRQMDPSQLFYRKNKEGELLSLTITTVDAPEYVKTAELIIAMWKQIGVHAALQAVSAKQFNKEILKNRDYQILLYGEIIGGDPDLFPFWHSSQTDYPGLNLSLFSNRDADKLLEEARLETTPDKREEMYKKFQELLAKELPAVFLYAPSHIMAMDKKIKGARMERITRPSDRYNGLSDWYIKTKWTWK